LAFPYGQQTVETGCHRESRPTEDEGPIRANRSPGLLAGVDANAAMVRDGMAWAFTRYLTDPAIRGLEARAKAERVGLWVDSAPVAPWEWRRESIRK